MEIIALSTKSQNSEVMDERTTQSCVPDLYSPCLCFLYCREKSLFKLYGSVVLFKTESIHLVHDRRSTLTVTQEDNKTQDCDLAYRKIHQCWHYS